MDIMYEFVTTCVHFDASATLYFPFFSLHKYVCLVLWYIIMNAAMGVCHEVIHPSGSPPLCSYYVYFNICLVCWWQNVYSSVLFLQLIVTAMSACIVTLNVNCLFFSAATSSLCVQWSMLQSSWRWKEPTKLSHSKTKYYKHSLLLFSLQLYRI